MEILLRPTTPGRARGKRRPSHLLVFGPFSDPDSLAELGGRWAKCVEISYNPDVRRERAGLLTDGVVLIRPDGHIGFRFPAALATLDRHLSSYLIPDPTIAPF